MQMNAAVVDKRIYDELFDEHQQLKLVVTGLQQQLSQLQRMIFGSKHERFVAGNADPSQLSLDIKADTTASCSVADAKRITYTRTQVSIEQKPLIHPGRMKLPEHLRREEIIIEPLEDVSSCKRMDEEVTEVLDWQPGELFVKRYVRVKYAKPGGEGVLIGKLPSRPLEKAMAGPGLLAQIVIDKYVDHLPLHRQMPPL